MDNLNNWEEVTKGLYRYVIATNVSYEIHIKYWDHADSLENATSELFLVGDWHHIKDSKNTTERELLSPKDKEITLKECILLAVQDNKENNE